MRENYDHLWAGAWWVKKDAVKEQALLFSWRGSSFFLSSHFLIHEADPQSRPVVIIVSAIVVRPSDPTFENKANFKRKQCLLLAILWVWPSGSFFFPSHFLSLISPGFCSCHVDFATSVLRNEQSSCYWSVLFIFKKSSLNELAASFKLQGVPGSMSWFYCMISYILILNIISTEVSRKF